MIEKTMFFLKPEANPHVIEIVARITEAGLNVEPRGRLALSAWALKRLYPGLSEKLQEATNRHLLDAHVFVYAVSGENAINLLVDLAGRNVNPKKCGPKTIRRLYGSKQPIAIGPGLFYYRNGIHRPQNAEEAARDLALFFG